YGAHLSLHSFPTRRSSDLRNTNVETTVAWSPGKLTDDESLTPSELTSLKRVNGSSTSDGLSCATSGKMTSRVSATSTTSMTLMRSEEHTSELQSRFDLVCR